MPYAFQPASPARYARRHERFADAHAATEARRHTRYLVGKAKRLSEAGYPAVAFIYLKQAETLINQGETPADKVWKRVGIPTAPRALELFDEARAKDNSLSRSKVGRAFNTASGAFTEVQVLLARAESYLPRAASTKGYLPQAVPMHETYQLTI